jgi:pimeloyl-ACP methyl ester carboxylesterase
MEPRIQYAKTSDGVNIAYSSFGTGPALVYTPHPIWGIRLSSWQVPEARACYERLARGRMLVRYDSRGTGESDRSAKDYSLEGLLRDLEAVVDSMGLESFALVGSEPTGPVTIAYAVRYPDRVSHLILWSAVAAMSTYFESSFSQAVSSLRSMAGQEWELYVKTMVDNSYSGAGGDLLRRLAELWRRSVSPSELPAIIAGIRAHDATSLLSQVRAPTLVIHWRDNRVVPVEEARRIAASIPGAELLVREGEDPSPEVGLTEAAAQAIDEFLGEPEPIAHAGVRVARGVMEQQVSFCTTPDGTRLAYAEYGPPAGPALVYLSFSHLSQESVWSLPDGRTFLEDLGRMRRLITFDRRGMGASQRDVGPIEWDVDLADMDFLADHLGLTQFDLFAIGWGGATYAARYRTRVKQLILWAAIVGNPFPAETLAMIRNSWGLYTRAAATVMYPGGPPEALRWISDAIRSSCTPEYYATTVSWSHDPRPDLPEVKCPTLVLHPIEAQHIRVEEGREVAALIRGAKFVGVRSAGHLPFWDREKYMPIVRDFLGVAPEESSLLSGTGATIRVPSGSVGTFAGGRYTVVRQLGEGAQKTVYLVRDTALDRHCALALLKTEAMDADGIFRIKREAQAMGSLTHPNIVVVYDVGEEAGRPYIVCEYVPGGDLQQELRRAAGPLPLDRALAIGQDVCRALAPLISAASRIEM